MLACSHATIFPHTQTHETCVLKHGEAVEAGVISDRTCFIITSYYFRDPFHRGSDELSVLSLISGSSDVEDEFPD